VLAPAAFVVIPLAYQYLGKWMGILLLMLSLVLISSERSPILAAIIFLCSGLFGHVVLGSLQPSSSKLFSMLTGCFGFGILILALLSGKPLPSQKPAKNVSGGVIPGSLLGSFSGFLVGIFPAVSCSQSVALLSPLIKSEEGFISAVAAASTSNLLFSAITLLVMDKARNGVMVSLNHLDLLSFVEFSASFSLAVLPAIIAAFILGDFLLDLLGKYYQKLILGTATFLILMALYLGGPWGLLVFLTSASLGLLTTCLGVRKTECMGMLLIPTILFYLSL
jgi:putative membrane protein